MEKVLASKLKIGDVLWKDITSDKGILILKKGTVLNEKLIDKIRNSKFAAGEIDENFVFIEKDLENSNKDIAKNKECTKKEIALLEKRFEKVKDDKLMNEIKEIIKDVIIKHAGQI